MKRKILLTFLLLTSNAFALTPQELLEIVKKRNLDLGISKKEVESSYYSYLASNRFWYPKFSFSTEFQEFYPYVTFSGKSWNQSYSLGFAVSMNLLDFRRKNQAVLDNLTYQVSKESFKVSEEETYFKALTLLYQLKEKELLLALRREALEDSRKIFKVAKDKYSKGLVFITDLLKAKAELQKAFSSLTDAQLSYQITFNQLNELLDYSLKEDEKPELSFRKTFSLKPLGYYINLALKNRPQVKRARKEVELARKKISLEKASLSPSLTLSTSYNRSGTEFFPENNNYAVTLSFSYPIFDSGITKLRVLSQKKLFKSKLLSLRKVENRVKREVMDAYFEVKKKEATLESSESFLNYSKKAYEKVLKGYKLGVVDIVNLLQTHSTYVEAKASYIASLLDFNLAILKLRKSTGTLLGGEY